MSGRVLLTAAGLAAASALVVAPAPSYDPWAWLLWGREVAGGALSTEAGPAFKPLPVAAGALLAAFGSAAPPLWVLLVRAATVVAAWLAYRHGRRLAGGSHVAGGLAAAGVLLCGALLDYAASGVETPLLLALALGGAWAWQAGRPAAALGCGTGCALLRVEAWPFLLVAGIVLWRRREASPRLLIALALAVPAAWFVPEWLGSGDVLRSGTRARVPNPGQPALADVPALATLRAAAGLALWPLLAGAALAVAAGARELRLWVAVGIAWICLVAVMAQAGFSGEPRYALPGAALLAVAGAAGLVTAARRTARPALVTGLAIALAAAAALPRVVALGGLPEAQAHQWALAADLDDALAAAGGREALLRCGRPHVGRLRGPLAAHALSLAKHSVEADARPRAPGFVMRSRLTPGAEPQPAVPRGFVAVGRAGEWTIHAYCSTHRVRVP